MCECAPDDPVWELVSLYKVAFLTHFLHQIAMLCIGHVRCTTLSFHTGFCSLLVFRFPYFQFSTLNTVLVLKCKLSKTWA